MIVRAAIVSLFLILTALPNPSHADSLTLYNGWGANANLLTLPGKILTGKLEIDDSRFTGLGYQRNFTTPAVLGSLFEAVHLTTPESAFELVALKHRGLQTNSEIALAYNLSFAGAALGPLRIKPGLSWGFSWAIGRPTYEDGPKDDPTRRYRFQNHLGLELAFTPVTPSPWSVIAKVHHRSGVYGIVAPRNVGSNFMALGLRYSFE
jgi:hypothetical protein